MFGSLLKVLPTEKPFECLSLDIVGGFNYYISIKKYLHLVLQLFDFHQKMQLLKYTQTF